MMDIKKLKKNIKKDIIIIEDASQAVGLKINMEICLVLFQI